jgi:hypothetical protein
VTIQTETLPSSAPVEKKIVRNDVVIREIPMNAFLKSLLTGRDNLTYDVGRVLLLLGGLVFLACTVLSVLKTMQFDMEKFGYGLGALLGGGGMGIGAKGHTEPGDADDDPR